MEKKTVLVFAVLISVSFGNVVNCPRYTCVSGMETNTCATLNTNKEVSLNRNGCSSGYECWYIIIGYWAKSLAEVGSSYSCNEVHGTPEDVYKLDKVDMNWTQALCEKQPNKTFKSGATNPIACTSDSDCELTDGSFALCWCALTDTGKGICMPQWSNDQLFSGFWEECGADNTVDNWVALYYWWFYMATWTYQHSDLDCIEIFVEPKWLDELYQNYTDSVNFAAGAFGVAALFT